MKDLPLLMVMLIIAGIGFATIEDFYTFVERSDVYRPYYGDINS
jgi:hypothetical protein